MFNYIFNFLKIIVILTLTIKTTGCNRDTSNTNASDSKENPAIDLSYLDNKLNLEKIESRLMAASEQNMIRIIDHLSNIFITADNFSERRIENRVKLNRLNNSIYGKDKEKYIVKSAHDLLRTNYLSIAAHKSLIDYYKKNNRKSLYEYHKKILDLIKKKIKSSGNGSIYNPYSILTLSEIESYLSENGSKIEGQLLYKRHDNLYIVKAVYSKTDNGPLLMEYFNPLSVKKLENGVLKKAPLSEEFLLYYLFSELALFDDSAKMGLIEFMNNHKFFNFKKHSDSLIKELKSTNNLFIYIELSYINYKKHFHEKNKDKQLELLNIAANDLTHALDKNLSEAYYRMATIEASKMDTAEGNYPLYLKYLSKSRELGDKMGSYYLYRSHIKKEDLSKEKLLYIASLIKESFDRGLAAASVDYSNFERSYGNITGKLPHDTNALLDKAISIGNPKAMLYRAKTLSENKSRTQQDIYKAKELYEKLLAYNNTREEINEIAWVYATDKSEILHDNNRAVELLRSLYKKYKISDFNALQLDTFAKVSEISGDYCNAIKLQKIALSKLDKKSSNKKTFLDSINDYTKKYTAKHNRIPQDNIICEKSIFHETSEKYNIKALGFRKGVYTGKVDHGMANGWGEFHWDNGDFYMGNFINNNQNGFGSYWWSANSKWKNSKYEGYYKDSYRNGFGMYVWDNGDLYIGEHKDNAHTGKGITIFINGSRYSGDLENGEQHGRGSYVTSDGYTYKGDFQNDFFHGRGISVDSIGSVYIGDFYNNDMHGNGFFTWLSGSSFRGKFVKNELHGNGICKFDKGPFPCVFENDVHIRGEFNDKK